MTIILPLYFLLLITFTRLNVDYRQFDAHDIEPLFEFGFGLSYTRFEYFGLHTAFSDDSAPEAENWRAGLSPSGSDTVGSSIQEW
jgi:beta-glucosidase